VSPGTRSPSAARSWPGAATAAVSWASRCRVNQPRPAGRLARYGGTRAADPVSLHRH